MTDRIKQQATSRSNKYIGNVCQTKVNFFPIKKLLPRREMPM